MPVENSLIDQVIVEEHTTAAEVEHAVEPIVKHVEIGTAKLNKLSHHEHIRCAKLVNPAIIQV